MIDLILNAVTTMFFVVVANLVAWVLGLTVPWGVYVVIAVVVAMAMNCIDPTRQ